MAVAVTYVKLEQTVDMERQREFAMHANTGSTADLRPGTGTPSVLSRSHTICHMVNELREPWRLASSCSG